MNKWHVNGEKRHRFYCSLSITDRNVAVYVMRKLDSLWRRRGVAILLVNHLPLFVILRCTYICAPIVRITIRGKHGDNEIFRITRCKCTARTIRAVRIRRNAVLQVSQGIIRKSLYSFDSASVNFMIPAVDNTIEPTSVYHSRGHVLNENKAKC